MMLWVVCAQLGILFPKPLTGVIHMAVVLGRLSGGWMT